jgi:hypothetical protein
MGCDLKNVYSIEKVHKCKFVRWYLSMSREGKMYKITNDNMPLNDNMPYGGRSS